FNNIDFSNQQIIKPALYYNSVTALGSSLNVPAHNGFNANEESLGIYNGTYTLHPTNESFTYKDVSGNETNVGGQLSSPYKLEMGITIGDPNLQYTIEQTATDLNRGIKNAK